MSEVNEKPEALPRAKRIALAIRNTTDETLPNKAADELERQHAEIQRLTAELEAARMKLSALQHIDEATGARK